MTVSHSAQMQEYQKSQANDFVRRFQLSGRRIVEIGCGDGNYLRHLTQAGGVVYGTEPSARFRELASMHGFSVHSGYIDSTSPAPGGPYEAFVCRQVLEHVPDPKDFLLGIRRSLSDNGVGLIEVPSLEQAVRHNRFFDFFADHLNYFSQVTLRLALHASGFDIVDTYTGMNDEFNIALVRVSSDFGTRSLDESKTHLIAELRAWTDRMRHGGTRIAVWGAGGKGLAVLAAAELEGLCYVIDSDPHKQGYFTPVQHLPVVAPEHLIKYPVDALVLTALAYRNEILTELRTKLGFRGPVAVLGSRLEILA